MDALGSIVLGLMILVVAFLMRRAGRRSQRRPESNVAEDVRNQFLEAERTGRSDIEKLELRLHEFHREIDALTQTRIALLEQLVAAADRTICELDERLGEDSSAPADVTPQQCRMIALLHGAGHEAESIAALVERPVEAIREVLANGEERSEAA